MIKIKDIIKEHKIVMTEAFKSGKLRALTNKWQGLDSTFFAYGSKLGIEWDKITDAEIETNTKPKKKGIEIAYIDKDVSVEMKGKQSYYMRGSKMGIDKFTAISVLKDGKPLWYTKGWRPITNVMTATGKTTKRTSYSGPRSKVPDVTAGSRSYSRDKTFGMNELGYQALSHQLMEKFSWGHTFFELNENLLNDYQNAKSEEDIRTIIQEYGYQV